MKGWQFYRTKTLQVVPYMKGTPVWLDGMLPFLYMKLKEEGKVAATFCGDNKTLDDFVSYFHRNGVMQVLCTVGTPEDPDRLVPVGFSWVDNPRGVDGQRVAMPGEAFFKGSEKVSRHLAKLSLGYAMHDLRIDIFHGVQCVSNFAAKNFSIRCGFKEVAIIPKYHFVDGHLEDARIMMLEAKDYLPKFFDWKESIDLLEGVEKPVEEVS